MMNARFLFDFLCCCCNQNLLLFIPTESGVFGQMQNTKHFCKLDCFYLFACDSNCCRCFVNHATSARHSWLFSERPGYRNGHCAVQFTFQHIAIWPIVNRPASIYLKCIESQRRPSQVVAAPRIRARTAAAIRNKLHRSVGVHSLANVDLIEEAEAHVIVLLLFGLLFLLLLLGLSGRCG